MWKRGEQIHGMIKIEPSGRSWVGSCAFPTVPAATRYLPSQTGWGKVHLSAGGSHYLLIFKVLPVRESSLLPGRALVTQLAKRWRPSNQSICVLQKSQLGPERTGAWGNLCRRWNANGPLDTDALVRAASVDGSLSVPFHELISE